MAAHSIFYFSCGSLTEKQWPLLKIAAIYFHEFYILDPERASRVSIGIDDPQKFRDVH